MKILIVSGFLGAGKTTFIKELISRSQEQLVVLENEYGQNSLDSNEIKNSSDNDLQLIEFMEGCVCCSQKDEFSNTILTISAGLDPDYLIVEPTGVGKLSNILLNIEKVKYEKIQVLPPVVVICPQSYEENINLYGDICEDQLVNASKIIFSKTEHTSADVINQVKAKILAINPDAEIVDEHYSKKDDEWFEDLLHFDGERKAIIESENSSSKHMDQITLKDVKLHNVGELVVFLEDIIRYEYGLIPRAKGIIQISDYWVRFDLADQQYAIIEEENSRVSECVIIGKYLNRQDICAQLGKTMNPFRSKQALKKFLTTGK